MKTVRLILGDQLNSQHSWFAQTDENVHYVMMELRQETDYVRHHIQKVLAFFAAMRAFAVELQQRRHTLHYIKFNDATNSGSLTENLLRLFAELDTEKFEYMQPDEYRLDRQLVDFCASIKLPSESVDSEHFFTRRQDVARFFDGKKHYLMESFYRSMRRKHDILMDGDKPIGGQWNFDADNRNRYDETVDIPEPRSFQNDVSELRSMLERENVKTIGYAEDTIIWPITREQSLLLLEDFVNSALPYFGRFQDAMSEKSWSLFHSRLSLSLNSKMLHPMEVISRAIDKGRHNRNISLAQIEGFVRQILGWREYMRGMYWALMPDLADMNFFDHQRPLPHFYWDGDTKMNCVKHAVDQSLQKAYAHHIQRLMVTGNFALLAGIHPDAVDQWYLGIYLDAVEWVEITNTRGMSQFADGGKIATKPYVSSANYINKMSDYCTHCSYDKNKKVGDRACPFNSLYWHFCDRHRDQLENNPRIAMMVRTWDRMQPENREQLLQQATIYLNNIEQL